MQSEITRLLFVIFLAGGAIHAPLPGQEQLDAREQKTVIDSLTQVISDYYVFPEVAEAIGARLAQNWESGAYRSVTDPLAFADRLTEDLQSVNSDKHLGVRFDPRSNADMRRPEPENPGEDHPEEIPPNLKRSNFGFQEVKILDGNVGYIDLRGFLPPSIGGDAAAATMNFLANTDAIIFDLRRNGGGSPGMIQLLTSYLYSADDDVHLNNFYYRPTNDTSQTWTLPYVPGKRNPDAEVFVLTSNYTFSAAEEFTYNLKNLERATIVGETTGGGAHPGAMRPVADRYVAFIPTGRAINPITNTNWEGTGVTPHVAINSEEAFDKAYLMALENLVEKAEDKADKQYYEWHAQIVRARQNPPDLSPGQLQSYAGQYGGRSLLVENGILYYQRQGRPKMRLEPLSENSFILAGQPEVRFSLEMDGEQPTTLVVEFDSGRRERHPRTVP